MADQVEGFTPLTEKKFFKSSGVPATASEGTRYINRDGNLTPEVKLSVDEPVQTPIFTRTAEGDIKNPHNRGTELACEHPGRKHSGKATMFLSDSRESDLTSTPYALCDKHVKQVQERHGNNPNIVLTPITSKDIQKHITRKYTINKVVPTLTMESALRTGGYEAAVSQGTEKPPAQVSLPEADLLIGRETKTFGVRGKSLATPLQEVKARRTPEEQNAILNAALVKLRSGESEKIFEDIESGNVERESTGQRGQGYYFPPRNPQGLLRTSSWEWGVTPSGKPTVTPGAQQNRGRKVRNVREHPGTNEPNKTVESVPYGTLEEVIARLPEHLKTADPTTGVVRSLTPVERFAESRVESNQAELESLRAGEATANKMRTTAKITGMSKAERLKLEAEIRKNKSLGFREGTGEITE